MICVNTCRCWFPTFSLCDRRHYRLGHCGSRLLICKMGVLVNAVYPKGAQ